MRSFSIMVLASALSLAALACGSDGGDDDPANGGGSGGSSQTGGSSSGGGFSTGGFTSNGGKATDDFLAEPPACGDREFRFEGTVDGVAVSDVRTQTGINAGYVNGAMGQFNTAAGGSSDQMQVHLEWEGAIAYGDAAPTTAGTFVPPEGSPYAGQELCVTEGMVGFVGDFESGYFKARITGARLGPDCSGEEIMIDIHGCYG